MTPHAHRRARERYGISIAADEELALTRRVAEGHRLTLRLATDCDGKGNDLWAVNLRNRWLAAVVSPGGVVVTFLPAGRLGPHQARLRKHGDRHRLGCVKGRYDRGSWRRAG